ncbi:MAG: STAS domain-containing protein [Rhodanobacter sp.]|nr:MAG: STAS domain-containing protein [Rhodanobacter sp.]TAM13834.1 MAG: STAS domain-containing protein [Rhodanobacter sp.]TAM37693.1 MAG: STAS domain-containing protein [Rhodanobacter sp.]
MGGRRATKQGGMVTVSLPADCRIGAQVAVHAELVAAVQASAVALDGTRVERVDTAALQQLWLFARALEKHGGALTWKGASQALEEAAATLGLTTILQLPAQQPA